MKKNKKQKGFSLIETIVAIFIISTGIVAVLSMNHDNIAASSAVSNRLTAVYLSQEGIEIVKNIRDTNFLKNYQVSETNWYEGLTECGVSDGCGADYNDSSLIPLGENFLGINANGFYNYDESTGGESNFKRKISVTPRKISDNTIVLFTESDPFYLEAIVTVSWEESGNQREVVAQENLYNWWQ